MRLVMFCLFLSLAPADASAQWTGEQQAVVDAIEGYLEAWNAHDVEQLMSHCDAQYDRIDARGNIYASREEVYETYRRLFSTRPEGVERRLSYEILSVRVVTGDVAIVDAKYELVGAPSRPPRTIHGMNTVVLVKRDGKWLRTAHRQRIPVRLADLERRDAAKMEN